MGQQGTGASRCVRAAGSRRPPHPQQPLHDCLTDALPRQRSPKVSWGDEASPVRIEPVAHHQRHACGEDRVWALGYKRMQWRPLLPTPPPIPPHPHPHPPHPLPTRRNIVVNVNVAGTFYRNNSYMRTMMHVVHSNVRQMKFTRQRIYKRRHAI